jgi:hypothetical protein
VIFANGFPGTCRQQRYYSAVKEGIIHLKYSQNDLIARFNAINFTDPEENRFAYRFVNEADSNWNELNTQNGIALTNLSSGTHISNKIIFSE